MTIRQIIGGRVVRWRSLLFVMVLVATVISLGGCLEAFTQGTNRPRAAYDERDVYPSNNALPTPQLFDFTLNTDKG